MKIYIERVRIQFLNYF
jgi:adenylate kinase